nr:MAG TPA: hypothetical protein [Caudoviricetes sp.]
MACVLVRKDYTLFCAVITTYVSLLQIIKNV